MSAGNTDAILQKTWHPQLAGHGARGLSVAGEWRQRAAALFHRQAVAARAAKLRRRSRAGRAQGGAGKRPPYDAEIRFDAPRGENGWNAPTLAPWLETALDKASHAAFGRPVAYQGEGGSIPFMAMLGRKFPGTQFVVTGVLGPHSNAHGPNEFLHIPFARKLSACIAAILADHALRTA